MNPIPKKAIATTRDGMIPAMESGLNEVEARVKEHLNKMGFVWN